MALYKYLPPDPNIVIGNLKLRFTRPSGLNDPFELRPHFDHIATQHEIADRFNEQFDIVASIEGAYEDLPLEVRSRLNKASFVQFAHDAIANNKEVFEGTIQNVLDSFFRELPKHEQSFRDKLNEHLERIGILSLTTEPDSIYMWTHYAAAHSGYAVEFDESHPYFDRRRTEKDEFFYLREVAYYDQLPKYTSLGELDGTKVFCTKSSHYAQEKEWRMLVPLSPFTQESNISEELFDFPADAVRSVVFGAKSTEEFRAMIRQRLVENPEFSHVTCRQVTADHQLGRLTVHDTESSDCRQGVGGI